MSGTVVHIFHLLLYLNLYDVTGGLAAGAMAGIFIGAVIFALLLLMIIAVIIWHKCSHAKNKKSTNVLHAYNPTTVGDLQTDHHQVERSQSYAQPLDAITPKDSTPSDNQSNTVLQASDRQQFLKREVCRIFVRPLCLSTLLLTRRLQGIDIATSKCVIAFATVFTCFLFFLQYSETNLYSFSDEEPETNLSHEARLIYASAAHSVIHNVFHRIT